MILYHIILLAVIQGLTEFLPVSSSGHLGLFHCFTDQCDRWDSENLTMDVAVHVGTLFSVVLYFWRDVLNMIFGVKDIACTNFGSKNAKLTLYVIISSLPVVIIGFLLHFFEPDWLKTLYVIAWTTIIFGFVLWWADKKGAIDRTIDQLTLKDSILIGLSQILALIPGTSRSGITMTAARFLGFSRTESAHYSLLLSMVAISGAGTLIGLSLMDSGDFNLGMEALVAIGFSFVSGWLAIAAMMKFLQRSSFTIFAVYRIALGAGLLGLLYGGFIS